MEEEVDKIDSKIPSLWHLVHRCWWTRKLNPKKTPSLTSSSFPAPHGCFAMLGVSAAAPPGQQAIVPPPSHN